MQKIDVVLSGLGLSTTEQKLYLTGLTTGHVGVRELTKQTGIQRTTGYHALNTLIEKGLASVTGTTTRAIFTMTPPEHLEKLLTIKIASLQTQVQAVREIAPLLAQQTAVQTGNTHVSQFDGPAGVKAVVEKALYCRSRTWDIIAPRHNFFSDFDTTYANYFMHTRTQRGITTRALWEKSKNRRTLTTGEIAQRNPRFLPPAMHGKFKSVVILFDDKVAFISSAAEQTAVLIQSPELYATMRVLFEGLWQISEPYKGKKIKPPHRA